ncbi:hypothetical protein V6D40_07235 [Corynebacterium sp. Q4381]|uniref:terminase small subunit n=1 Tax=Corynebacterium sp. Marseille-Q4381 TaxID=3121597 RepID=UPI002FE509B0
MDNVSERPVGELEQAFLDSLAALDEQPPAEYGGVVALGRAYAENIDESRSTDTETATKSLYLGPHLLGVMKLLGLAPTEAPETAGTKKGGTTSPDVIDIMRRMSRETAKENGA